MCFKILLILTCCCRLADHGFIVKSCKKGNTGKVEFRYNMDGYLNIIQYDYEDGYTDTSINVRFKEKKGGLFLEYLDKQQKTHEVIFCTYDNDTSISFDFLQLQESSSINLYLETVKTGDYEEVIKTNTGNLLKSKGYIIKQFYSNKKSLSHFSRTIYFDKKMLLPVKIEEVYTDTKTDQVTDVVLFQLL